MQRAADTSSMVAFFAGASGADIVLIQDALDRDMLMLPAVVRTEILSAPKITPAMIRDVQMIPVIAIKSGFWDRAGELRRSLLMRNLKCKLGDVLIAQSCIDHKIPIITRDNDFRHFVKNGVLKLL